jgi:hypothetical protein
MTAVAASAGTITDAVRTVAGTRMIDVRSFLFTPGSIRKSRHSPRPSTV